MVREINILFMGAAKRVSLLERFHHAAKHLNIKLNHFAYEISKYPPISQYAKIINGLKWDDENIIEHLQENIMKYKIDIVIPNVDPAIRILSNIKNRFPNIYFPVSEYKVSEIFYDKILANEWLKSNGFPVPSQQKIFPLIAKPRFGSASQGIKVMSNEIEYNDFFKMHNISNYLIQKFIVAQEYTVDGYISCKNKIIGLIPRKRLATAGGESTLASIDLDEEIIGLSEDIVNKAGIVGPVTLQFLKEFKTNQCYVMEINPRFGGGVILSIEAGLNIPYYILCDFLEVKYPAEVSVNKKLVMSRYFKEEFFETNN